VADVVAAVVAVAEVAAAVAVVVAAAAVVAVAVPAACHGVRAACANRTSFRTHCLTKGIMAGLDDIDPAASYLIDHLAPGSPRSSGIHFDPDRSV